MEAKRQIYESAEMQGLNFAERVHTAEIKEDNRTVMKKYQSFLYAKGCKNKRVGKLTYQLLNLIELLSGATLTELSEDDLILVIGKINADTCWSDATKSDYKRCLKQFYNWYKRNDERLYADPATIRKTNKFYLYLEKDVSTSYKKARIHENEIITEQDLQQLLSMAKTARNKAFIAVLHESGARIGEMLGLQIKDISKDYDKIRVDGKTGVRTINIKIISPVLLQRWVEQHPFKENPDSYVWIKESRKGNIPLNYAGANKVLRDIFKKVNFKKRANLHWFRHSRMTINAQFMTEPLLRVFAGWSASSDMPANYVHSGEAQVENSINKYYGLVAANDKPVAQKCFSCETQNSSAAQFCLKCGRPLNSNSEKLKQETETNALEFFEKVLNDNELKAKFAAFLEKEKK